MSLFIRKSVLPVILATTATPVLAAEERSTAGSDMAVWIFVGFCAVLILSQIVPAIRNANKRTSETIEEASKEKAAEHSRSH